MCVTCVRGTLWKDQKPVTSLFVTEQASIDDTPNWDNNFILCRQLARGKHAVLKSAVHLRFDYHR